MRVDQLAAVALLPAAVVVSWTLVWFLRRRRRWLFYFPIVLTAVVVVGVAGLSVARGAGDCTAPVELMCVSDGAIYALANAVTGFWCWLTLLAITTGVEGVRIVRERRRVARR
jgi:hypothetical protein